MSTIQKFYVVHPDFSLSETTAVMITDFSKDEFASHWKTQPIALQYEFGNDLPLWDLTVEPRKKIKMTFNEYVVAVQKEIDNQDWLKE